MSVGNVMLKHPHLQRVVRELNEGLTFIQGFGVTKLYDLLFVECHKETAWYLVYANNAFVRHRNAVFYARPFYLSALTSLTQMLK